MLPEVTIHFHPSILFWFRSIADSAFFSAFDLLCWYKLKKPVLLLLKDNLAASKTLKTVLKKQGIFIFRGSEKIPWNVRRLLCFSLFLLHLFFVMTQMSFSSERLFAEMMGVMILMIGLVLAFTTLFLAITTVINGTQKLSLWWEFLAIHKKNAVRQFSVDTLDQSASVLRSEPISTHCFDCSKLLYLRMLYVSPAYKFDFPVMLFFPGCFYSGLWNPDACLFGKNKKDFN